MTLHGSSPEVDSHDRVPRLGLVVNTHLLSVRTPQPESDLNHPPAQYKQQRLSPVVPLIYNAYRYTITM